MSVQPELHINNSKCRPALVGHSCLWDGPQLVAHLPKCLCTPTKCNYAAAPHESRFARMALSTRPTQTHESRTSLGRVEAL